MTMLDVAPDPAQPATTLANGVGHEVLDVATALAPIAVPFVLTLTAIRWVLKKFALGGSGGLGAMYDHEAAIYDQEMEDMDRDQARYFYSKVGAHDHLTQREIDDMVEHDVKRARRDRELDEYYSGL